MKTKYVLHIVEYLYLGGIERLLEQLALNTGADTDLLFFTYETETLCGIGKSIQEHGFQVFTYKKTSGRDWRLFLELARVIKKHNIDVVHTHDFGPTEYAILLKLCFPAIRLIHTQHTLHHFISNTRYRYFFQFASYFYYKMVTVSEFVKRSIVQSCPFIQKSKLVVIYNGVDTNKFRPSSLADSADNKLRLVTVARISAEKNLLYLLNTCRLLKEHQIPFHFDHAGTSTDPERRIQLENYVKDNDLESHVTLHGFQANTADLLNSSEFYISSSFTEGHPVAVLEAMATGKICLCSDIDPHRETSQGALELFDITNENALFEKLKNIYWNKPNLQEQKNKSREVVLKRYSLARMMDGYGELYR